MKDGEARSLFAGIVRLVPFSGIQILDVEIAGQNYRNVETHFVEEIFDAGGAPQRVLLPLDSRLPTTQPAVAGDTANPGSSVITALDRHYHPLTGRVVDPGVILKLDAAATMAHFAGHWVPLPYLRFVGRDEHQQPQFDSGPSNWVRALIAPLVAGSDNPVRVTLAFDTNLEPQSRLDEAAYLAPNLDDAAFGSTFVCAESVEEITPLLAEPWLGAWLAQPFNSGPSAEPAPGVPGRFQHVHIAHYLNLLRILAASAVMPEVRFTDTIQRRYPIRTSAIDLVLDIGDTETSAVLVDVTTDTPAEHETTGYAEIVRLRDLSAPHHVHESPFLTAAEFSAAPFGDALISRESGRLDAFQWPSLVRIGEEARALSLRSNGAEGVTGLSNLRSFLLDDAASSGIWRQSTTDHTAPGPMVSGELLSLISESGSVLGGARADPTRLLLTDQRPAIRPRFSRASLMGFFVAELVLHALAQINSATRAGRGAIENEVRELRHVIVLAPSSLSAQEQNALLAKVEDGLALVWRGLGWEVPANPGIPKRPEVVLGTGGDLGTQIAFLHNEVTAKYQGRFADLLRVYRGSDVVGTAAEALRVASIELGARGTTLMLVDYASADGPLTASEWQPAVQVSERLPIGTDAALQSLIWKLVLPAIEAQLSHAGLNPARNFLDEITGRSAASLLVDDPYFTRRLNRKVLWPAARGLFALNEYGAASLAHGNRAVTLATLVELGCGRLEGVAAQFDAAALQAGARGFTLAATKLDLNRGEIGAIIRAEMHDSIEKIARAVAAQSCDLLLLSGEGMRLPALRDEVFAILPLPASRIIDLTTYVNQTASDAMGQTAPLAAAALLPALATALDRRHLLEASGLGSQALRRIALAPPSEASPAQRAISAPVERDTPRTVAPRSGVVPAKGA